MTDEEQARSALAEVARRRDETVRLAGGKTSPAWSVAASVAAILAMTLVFDLREQDPGWGGWFVRWAVPAICFAVIVTCGVAAYRRASVTLHRSAYREKAAETIALGVSLYFGMLAIGIPMRLYRVPFDQTVSLAGAGLIVGGGWLLWRRARARRG